MFLSWLTGALIGGIIGGLMAHRLLPPTGNTSQATLDELLRCFLIFISCVPGALLGSMVASLLD